MHITNAFMTHYEMSMVIQVEPDQEGIFVSTPKAFLAAFPRTPNSLGTAWNFLLLPSISSLFLALSALCSISHAHFIEINSTCPLKLHQIPFPPKSFCSCHLLEVMLPDQALPPQALWRALMSIYHALWIFVLFYLFVHLQVFWGQQLLY